MVGWAKESRGIFEYLFLSSFSFSYFQNSFLSLYVSPSHISMPLRELSPMNCPSIHLFFWFRLWLLSFMVYLFLGFCLLVAFVLLENGALHFIIIGAMVPPLCAVAERVRCRDRCMVLLSTSFLVCVPAWISGVFVSSFITCKKCGCRLS